MGSEKQPTLRVVYTDAALRDLNEIWNWNEARHNHVHANQYIEFLEDQIDALGIDWRHGRNVISRPDLNFILIQRKSKGHGHIAVYRVSEKQIHVLHVFHSAQDWQSQITEDPI